MTTTERFEDRLLEQLRTVVVDAGPPMPELVTSRRPRTARLALAGAGVAAATAAVAIVAASNDATPSAYAVQSRADGAVTVSIHSLSDADGLQRKLRAAGVPAVVDYVPGGRSGCAGPGLPAPGAAGKGATLHTEIRGKDDGPTFSQEGQAGGPPPGGDGIRGGISQVMVGSDGARFTIDPGAIHPGDKVYITTSSGAVSSIAMAIGKTRPATPCPPAPPAP